MSLRSSLVNMRRAAWRRPSHGRNERAGAYANWLEQRMAERSGEETRLGRPGLLSVLTCVYAGSPSALFKETARSVLDQTQTGSEWVVLVNGSVPRDLERIISELTEESRVRVIESPANLGIMTGLRRCLEAASGEYVMPLDADDLLTRDALEVIGAAIEANGCPDFLYGDEDAWVNGGPCDPYFRPSWDPVLNLASSYIWHPSVMKREAALRLGVFTDSESEYCQDWDTVFRFAHAGVTPVHIAEILYHWRAHEASSTHRADRASGSLRSQRHVLQEHIATLPDSGLFSVEDFPLDRGLPEPWIRRAPIRPPRVDILFTGDRLAEGRVLSDDELLLESGLLGVECPVQTIWRLGQDGDRGDASGSNGRLADLKSMVERSSADLFVVLDCGLRTNGTLWLWEAIGLLDLVPAASFAAGRLTKGGLVVSGEMIVGSGGEMWLSDQGRSIGDAGYYSLALKPHLCDAFDARLFVARRADLAAALDELPLERSLPHLGLQVSLWARQHGRLIAYSPLIEGEWRDSVDASETPSPLPLSEAQRQQLQAAFRPDDRDSRWSWRRNCSTWESWSR